MSAFSPHHATFRGRLLLQGEIDEVFSLFSPMGEKLWVPSWDPELLYPENTEWSQGQIFRTREETGEAVWIVTRLHRALYEVQYHRIEPGRYVARIEITCCALEDRRTEASTIYSFVGLSEAGNREIATMTQRAYDEKMARWTEWINNHLVARRKQPNV